MTPKTRDALALTGLRLLCLGAVYLALGPKLARAAQAYQEYEHWQAGLGAVAAAGVLLYCYLEIRGDV